MHKLNFLSLGLLVLSATATSAQNPQFRIDPNTDFLKYKSYKWVHSVKGDHVTYPVDAQITTALDAELAKKGLMKTDSDVVGLSLCYHSNFGTEKFNRYNSEGEGTYYFTIKTGQVAIDMYDASSMKLVWRNTADIDPKAKPEHITKAVAKLLKKYPPERK